MKKIDGISNNKKSSCGDGNWDKQLLASEFGAVGAVGWLVDFGCRNKV